MKRIAIGLAAYDSKELAHQCLELSTNGSATLFRTDESDDVSLLTIETKALAALPIDKVLRISAKENLLKITGLDLNADQLLAKVIVKASSPKTHLFLQFPPFGKIKRAYIGDIVILAKDSSIRVFVQCSLEEYLLGVLSSEIPASYHLEAIKAQAIAARTYALNPRVDHSRDQCQVCDSFLCCQCFLGYPSQTKSLYSQAIEETNGQVLIYQDNPILALFSSCAGGHTENYETCFSDMRTNAFPPEPIPYLKGVPEGSLPGDYKTPADEKALAALWHCPSPNTADAWASQFKWSITLPADSLEANMHHAIEKMIAKSDLAPFVIPPRSSVFGQIHSFEILKRGIGGTAVSMAINTSKGIWIVKKELIIRSAFENHEIKLPRLKSARIYFEHHRSDSGNLLSLGIFGLGSGHGVGLQQTGSEGFARKGKSYREILLHYFKAARIAQI